MPEPPAPESAFLPPPRVTLPPLADGALSGLAFAAKDLMDVAGFRKTSGNPDWARTHVPAVRTAEAIEQLRTAGARLVGKTVTDELAFSLEGDNIHYGTPLNPRCPDRVPGGSSSGSASAVASGSVDFALGTDTGGSVRVPSSFCGIFGIRPTHGRVPLDGVTPLAPSLDTLGWMARDGATLARVGSTFFGSTPAPEPTHFTVVADAFELMERRAREALEGRVRSLVGDAEPVRVFDEDPGQWSETYRLIQGGEAWGIHGPWIREVHPRFAPPIAGRFEETSRISLDQVGRARTTRLELAARVDRLLGPGRVLLVPSAPTVALPKDPTLRAQASTEFRASALAIGAIAGHGGFPQVSLPIAELDGRPIGLGILGARGSDSALLALAASPRVRGLAASTARSLPGSDGTRRP